MNLLMSFSKSGATIYGSGSSSGASVDSNSTEEDEGSLVQAIANELLETSSLRHILLASGLTRKTKKLSTSLSLRQNVPSTAIAIIKEGSCDNSLARTCSDISRDAVMQGCSPVMVVGCHQPCSMPSSHPSQTLSPTAEQKSTRFFLEIQHRHEWQQRQQKQQQEQEKELQPQKSSLVPTASHGIYTIPVAAATSDSSCSVTTTDNSKNKTDSNGESSSLGFWKWISSV
jgi:hypothetical protein